MGRYFLFVKFIGNTQMFGATSTVATSDDVSKLKQHISTFSEVDAWQIFDTETRSVVESYVKRGSQTKMFSPWEIPCL